jgi:hypothetical protein
MKLALVVVMVAATAVLVGCGRSVHGGAVVASSAPVAGMGVAAGETPSTPAPASSSMPVAPPPAVAAAPGYEIGPPKAFGNLTVFAVLSKKQEDVGPMTTLDAALSKGVASVREMGSGPNGEGAQVGSLVIENRGAIPVYVLAGTIVKGGKQDRQIGQDFIVGANQTVPVDAFCVEHGRWTTNREGVATGGQFGVVGLLTDSRVRAAAEYGKDQGEVWARVAGVNEANKKGAASGTLLASVDSADLVTKRTALAKQVDGYIASTQPIDEVVGLAYAVDGKVRSVRWFSHHTVFELFRATLVGTAAMEAITARAAASVDGKAPAPAPSVASADVSGFIQQVQEGTRKEQRVTPALNVNEMQDANVGYSSSTVLKPAAGRSPAAPKAVSTSFTMH